MHRYTLGLAQQSLLKAVYLQRTVMMEAILSPKAAPFVHDIQAFI